MFVMKLQEEIHKIKKLFRVLNESDEYSLALRRRIPIIEENFFVFFNDLLQYTDQSSYSDEFEFADNMISDIVRLFERKYGDYDDYWFLENDEVSDYIKNEYGDIILESWVGDDDIEDFDF